MAEIIVATNNKHKLKEFKEILKSDTVLSLAEIGYSEDIVEDGETFLDNALIKARTISEFLKNKGKFCPVIADDSGLCVDALNGEPGVLSARYSGVHDDACKNRAKLINKLKNQPNRKANFVCCLVELYPDGSFISAEGKVAGLIIDEEKGDKSFGYDCIFYSNELNKTFGEASQEEKNSVSHRARAIANLLQTRNKQ